MYCREYELGIITYDGPDPLVPRLEYITWLEQTYIKHGRECNLIPLLEDTITVFKDDPKYKQDPRFIDLVVKYVSKNISFFTKKIICFHLIIYYWMAGLKIVIKDELRILNILFNFRLKLKRMLSNSSKWFILRVWEQCVLVCTDLGQKYLIKETILKELIKSIN